MEPDKFEKYIKNKMGEREIPPSNEAWDKISSQLNSPKKASNPNYFWVGIAASLLILVSLSLFYFNSSNEIEGVENNKVVNTEDSDSNNKINEEDKTIDLYKNVPDAIVMEEETEKNNINPTSENEGVKPKSDLVQEDLSDTNSLAANIDSVELPEKTLELIMPKDILNAKIAEVIAQVDAIEANGKVSDGEVDSLLLNAQKDILREKLFDQDRTVNAMALLTEVEDELDQSFRDQIFESLKAGFLKVRTAVADRNN